MDEEPQQPRDHSMETEAAEVRDARSPADHGEAALIVILEWLQRAAVDARQNRLGRVPALLHGHWRNTRDRFPILNDMRQVADYEALGGELLSELPEERLAAELESQLPLS